MYIPLGKKKLFKIKNEEENERKINKKFARAHWHINASAMNLERYSMAEMH